MAARDLLVRVLGDTRDVENAFARSSKAANQFGLSVQTTGAKADKAAKNLRGFATGAAVGFGGAFALTEVTQQLRASIEIASNLAEQTAKTGVVFGQSADEVKAWAQTTATSIGIAADQALAAASTFGAMFDQAGRSNEDAAELSQSVVKLAADLASFNNTNVDDALTALRSGLSGEIEPLRRFQVFLTEASVAAEAMAASGKKSAQELTQGEKIMARWSLILQQTTKQQGDFARTSTGLANQQRILSAQVRDLQANLGSLLVPALADVTLGGSKCVVGGLALSDALRGLSQVKIPAIRIPLVLDTGAGGGLDLGDVFRKAKGSAVAGFETQFPGLKFVNDLVDLFERTPLPDTKRAADAFDEKFDSFLESLEKDVDKSTKRADAKLKEFGQAGFKPLDANELGESLQRQFEGVIEALDLRFDQAVFAGNTQAALAALDKTETAIRQRIASQGRTTDLLRQLFQVERERATILREGREAAKAAAEEARELAREQAEAAREAQKALVQRNQFKAIGLSGTGGAIVPTVDNLQKQLNQLTNRLGDDITPKLETQLKNVGKVLAGRFGKVTEETRAAIRDLFQTIRGTFDRETQKEIVPPRRLQISDKILRALGFDQDAEVKAFRGAQQLAQKAPVFPTGVRPSATVPTAPVGGITITGPVTVVADNPDAFLRELQKKAGRTTATARGRFPGKSLGLG